MPNKTPSKKQSAKNLTAKVRDEIWFVMNNNMSIAASCTWWAERAIADGDFEKARDLVRKIWLCTSRAEAGVIRAPTPAIKSLYRYTYNSYKISHKIYNKIKKVKGTWQF